MSSRTSGPDLVVPVLALLVLLAAMAAIGIVAYGEVRGRTCCRREEVRVEFSDGDIRCMATVEK